MTEGQSCGSIVRLAVDERARTLYIETTTHGITVEWSGNRELWELPQVGEPVTYGWDNHIMVNGAGGATWLEVRSTAPEEMHTPQDQLLAASVVAMNATLSVLALGTGMNAGVSLLSFAKGSLAYNAMTPDLFAFLVATALLIGWRAGVAVRTRRKTIGLRSKPGQKCEIAL